MKLTEDVDVLVVGGGTAGVIAALQAARAGARTTIVEAGSELGGTMTTGGVSAAAYFWSRHRQIIAGIGWELIRKAKELDGSPYPDFSNPNPDRPSYHVGCNPHLYALVAEEACRQAGVSLHYYEFPTALTAEAAGWTVHTAGKGLSRTVKAAELIDCTGDAAVVQLAGLCVTRDEVRQPGTLEFRFEGYDADQLDEELIQKAYLAALADGRLQKGDFCYAHRPFISFLRVGGQNQQHIFAADTTTAATHTAFNLAARESLLRLVRFVRSLPGCENATLSKVFPAAAARDTWRILGEKTVTYEDYMAGRRYDDEVCYTLYYVDVHHDEGTHHEFLPYDVVPVIPLGALIPQGSRRLLAGGRIISSDKRAHSALRVEASCMAMGQAVGAAAALAVKTGAASRDVPLADIRALLREHQAIVPGDE